MEYQLTLRGIDDEESKDADEGKDQVAKFVKSEDDDIKKMQVSSLDPDTAQSVQIQSQNQGLLNFQAEPAHHKTTDD